MKKQSPKSSFFHSNSFVQPLKNAGSLTGADEKDPFKFAFRPFGGSLVILIPFCRIDTGKSFEGYEVSHRRKSR